MSAPALYTATSICVKTGMSRAAFYEHLNAEGDPYGLMAAQVTVPGMGKRYKGSRLHYYFSVCQPRPRKKSPSAP